MSQYAYLHTLSYLRYVRVCLMIASNQGPKFEYVFLFVGYAELLLSSDGFSWFLLFLPFHSSAFPAVLCREKVNTQRNPNHVVLEKQRFFKALFLGR